jgi:hypothetical protein
VNDTALRDASILYAVAANPVSGALYLAWQDDRFTTATCTTPTGTIPIDGIAFSQSTDGGATWSTPIMVNQTPTNTTNPCRQQAFVPAVAATGDGAAVVVTYYDFRNDTNAVDRNAAVGVAPRAGAWIETPARRRGQGRRPVAPRAGAWIETALSRQWHGGCMSPLAQGRGSKRRYRDNGMVVACRPSRRGVDRNVVKDPRHHRH